MPAAFLARRMKGWRGGGAETSVVIVRGCGGVEVGSVVELAGGAGGDRVESTGRR